MAFKELTVSTIDIKKEKGKAHVGVFDKFEEVPFKPPKKGSYGVWHFIGQDGLRFGVFGFSHLDAKMKNIKQGTLCRLTYLGTKFMPTPYKPSGQDVHQALVEVDDGNGQTEAPPVEEYTPE